MSQLNIGVLFLDVEQNECTGIIFDKVSQDEIVNMNASANTSVQEPSEFGEQDELQKVLGSFKMNSQMQIQCTYYMIADKNHKIHMVRPEHLIKLLPDFKI